jgi:hypothetical protein
MKPEVQDTDYLLNVEDRCDACQAQAYIYVALESGDLLFCLHHWKQHEEALNQTAIDIIDESDKLLRR